MLVLDLGYVIKVGVNFSHIMTILDFLMHSLLNMNNKVQKSMNLVPKSRELFIGKFF